MFAAVGVCGATGSHTVSAGYAYFGRSPRSLCDVGVDTRVSVVGAGVGVGVAVGFHVGSAVFLQATLISACALIFLFDLVACTCGSLDRAVACVRDSRMFVLTWTAITNHLTRIQHNTLLRKFGFPRILQFCLRGQFISRSSSRAIVAAGRNNVSSIPIFVIARWIDFATAALDRPR